VLVPGRLTHFTEYAHGPARQAAVDEPKDQNLANDCTREALPHLLSILDHWPRYLSE
jgi:hypothetical protein